MTDHDDESRIGAYAPPADEFATFDAREEETRRGTLLLTAAIAVLVLFMAVVYSAFNQGVREGGREGAPRLLADVEPYRERPADPGGEETPDTDLDVYNRLTGDDDNEQDVSLRPTPEEPIEDSRPALRVETVDADRTRDDTPDTSIETTTLPDVTPRPAPERPAPEAREPEPAAVEPDPVVPEPAESPAVADTAASEVAAPVAVPTGPWVVQIGSFRSISDAEGAWLAFSGRYSDISPGLVPDIVQVDIPNRGTYHRLRIAAFGSRDDAVRYCTTLQGRGQDCLVARR